MSQVSRASFSFRPVNPATQREVSEMAPGIMTAVLNEAVNMQWQSLYRELYKNSSEKMKTWSTAMHSIGQQANVVVEIKEGQGLEFMYALLGAHMNFTCTATDQPSHTTIPMDMHKLLADGGQPNPITAIENARLQLRQAGEVGGVPSYDMCRHDTIQAVGLILTERKQTQQAEGA